MSILATYLHKITKAPLHDNYGLAQSSPIENMESMAALEGGIFCFDEIWLSMDSRMWADNVRASRWVNQTRKKKMIVFYTTQHIRQVEMRVRNATDVLIYCEKSPEGHWLQFIDWQYRTLGKRYLIGNPRPFYGLYDTYKVLEPLTWKRKSTGFGTGYGRKSYGDNSRRYTEHSPGW